MSAGLASPCPGWDDAVIVAKVVEELTGWDPKDIVSTKVKEGEKPIVGKMYEYRKEYDSWLNKDATVKDAAFVVDRNKRQIAPGDKHYGDFVIRRSTGQGVELAADPGDDFYTKDGQKLKGKDFIEYIKENGKAIYTRETIKKTVLTRNPEFKGRFEPDGQGGWKMRGTISKQELAMLKARATAR